MLENQKINPVAVLGPDNEWLTLADLPPPDTERWVSRRKAQVIAAVNGGLLSVEEACQRYRMESEEFALWQSRFSRNGKAGLRVTHTQSYRRHEPG